MERIADREALGQVREASKAQVADSRCRILICAGTGCLAGGSGEIYERMCELVKDHPDVEVHFGPEIAQKKADATDSVRWGLLCGLNLRGFCTRKYSRKTATRSFTEL